MRETEPFQDRASSFEEFYTTKIAPYKNEYARKSRGANNKGWVASIGTIATILAFILFFRMEEPELIMFVPFVLLCVTIYFWYDYQVSENRFNNFFKEKVVGEILQFLLPGATLDPSSAMPEKYYKQSSLYRRIYHSYLGNDLVKAIYKGLQFQASEIKVERGTSRRRQETIFEGVFMKVALAQIKGGTYIWPKRYVQLPRSLADEHYRMMPLHEVYRVETGSREFNEMFTVYSSFPQEANSILTAERMQGMLNIRHQLKKPVRFSFVPGSFYASIANKEELLEAVDSLEDKDYIKNYFYSILAYPAIINQLRLYEYI